jgi:hypothetical protein
MAERTPQEKLLFEIREIVHVTTKKPWLDDAPQQAWAVVAGDKDTFAGVKLPPAMLAHFDAMEQYATQCASWPTANDEESFVPIVEWSERYDKWKKG